MCNNLDTGRLQYFVHKQVVIVINCANFNILSSLHDFCIMQKTQKTGHYSFVRNFAKCLPIFKIIVLLKFIIKPLLSQLLQTLSQLSCLQHLPHSSTFSPCFLPYTPYMHTCIHKFITCKTQGLNLRCSITLYLLPTSISLCHSPTF